MSILSSIFSGFNPAEFISEFNPQESNDITNEHRYNPNVFTSVGPVSGIEGDKSILPNTEFQSGMILIGPDIRLMKIIHNERDLLSKAGLKINPTDDIRIIRDSSGRLKGAIAFGTSHINQIKKIRYIDVDDDSQNFKKCMCYLMRNTESSTNPLKFYNSEKADVERDEIVKKFVID